ncbi:hypothetical protein [Streptomyces sp. SID4985]|uniref:hypothetical protein n=1 Tax=unclassified Streptomyces TaxID=2593676 RepID=UPI00136829D4|nr:hypothetical protein [Streptomyces sp. SID4985]MYQ47858.1 hypothetical protein [Streptomyces sp. SID4985]
MNPDPGPEPPPSYITPACARCGHYFQPGEPYDVVPVESGTGVAPDAYRHREPCAPS